MKHIKYIIGILLLLSLLTGCQTSPVEQRMVHDGVLDLTDWDFDRDGIVRLDGQWQFYWHRLFSPGETFDIDSLTGYYSVPGYWTSYRGLHLPSKGYATYRLLITLDDTDQILSIATPELYTQYKLWVNGNLIHNNMLTQDHGPSYLCPDIYDIYVDTTQLEVILQIENYKHVYAGVGQSFQLGAASILHQVHSINFALDFLLFSICFFAAIYHFLLFFFRKKNKELLYFSILCLSVGTRTILSNETILMKIIPDFPFLIGSKIVTFTIPLCVISMMLYIYALYKEDTPSKPLKIIIGIQFVYAILVVLCDSYLYSIIFIPYLLSVLMASLFVLYVSMIVIKRRRPEYLYSAAGSILITLGTVIDILVFLRVLHTSYYLSYSVVIFVLVQTILIGRRYVIATQNVNTLSSDLRQSLFRIEDTETAFLNAQIKPHFLYNTLNTIAQCCQSDPEEAEQLILYLSKYLRGTMNFENLGNAIPLKKELELVTAYCYIEKARFQNINIELSIDEEICNYPIPPLILQPLVENAIKHGIRENEVTIIVKLEIKNLKSKISFTIEDNGIGIRPELLSNLLTCPGETKSIGLYNIHTRLFRLYGSGLTLHSTVGVGTVVQFEIPIEEVFGCIM